MRTLEGIDTIAPDGAISTLHLLEDMRTLEGIDTILSLPSQLPVLVRRYENP